jgi:cyclic-di-AMP phosphodiesterase PgpH
LCLLGISAPILSILEFPYTSLPAIGLLVSSFYSPSLAICQVVLVTGLVMFSSQHLGSVHLLAGLVGGLITAIFAGRLRSREAISKLSIAVGLSQIFVYLIANLILSASATTIWSAILPDATICGLFGVAWIVVAIGISPYLERFFDLITPIRLAELSNPNLPLLKRLATEAPGTFQHTMFVASLAEAAARALNCNVELVRAGTLYHDIGKMHDPLGFIENQMGEPNKHDEINDPWVSAEIIKKHVSEGLVMARKYGLPKAIRDFIPQHQGSLLIVYFYYQAKQQAEALGTTVVESDFRYLGPVPQSREAGILMLADGSEAALRSLSDASPKKALATLQKIFKSRWQDHQLVDSGLAYDELPVIAEVFIRVWEQFNHKRIVYPKGALDLAARNNKLT